METAKTKTICASALCAPSQANRLRQRCDFMLFLRLVDIATVASSVSKFDMIYISMYMWIDAYMFLQLIYVFTVKPPRGSRNRLLVLMLMVVVWKQSGPR